MSRTVSIPLALFISVLAVVGKSNAQSEYDLVKIVTERNVVMHSMLGSYWPLLAIYKGESSDLVAAAEAAQSIKEGMNASMSMFPSGTAKGEVPVSRAKPEIWSESADFKAAADELISASETLTDIAKSGEVEAFKIQFQRLEKACVGCHGFKPSSGGKFRSAE
jgi:cytochrome c556